MILVTGAAGNAARRLPAALAQAGEQVRVLVRGERGTTWPDGVQVVRGDLRDPRDVAAALDGVRSVFLLVAEDGGAGFAAAARDARLDRVVLLSSKAVSDAEFAGLDNPLYAKHLRGEEFVRGLGVPWVFLRPGGLASNALRWAGTVRREGVVRALFPQLSAPLLDPRDLAEVAMAALLDARNEGRIHTLTGGEIVSVREQVRVLAEESGRPIRFEEITEEQAPELLGPTLPPGFLDVYIPVQKRYLETTPAVLPTVREILGRPARNFRDWARENAAQFR
jgi:uncharacterized protein YbjT (DUF2867 family)